MAHPKKRMSPVRSGNRRRNIGLDLPATDTCPNCKQLTIKHHTCRVCGQYKGREVLVIA
jgi:large subunit ribosomal protein L32